MEYLRTPDDRFENLADFDFTPNYVTVGSGLRMHHLDEGSPDADPLLAMHGEPSWCYLYRHMIPVFTAAGHRVLAPDLIGFGRSDKPVVREDYTYQRHVDWMTDWLVQLDLQRITLVCQDWGGLIGLRLVADMPDRFARLVLANTALPTGDNQMSPAFLKWRQYSQTADPFNAGRIVSGGTATKLSEAEISAYNAPFPDAHYQAGARQFPLLVPNCTNDPATTVNRKAWEVLAKLPIPVLTLFGEDDKISAGLEKSFLQVLPGTKGQNHKILPNAGHFLQEDVGAQMAQDTLDFIAAT